MVDLDHFKKINDQYGHTFGDQWLIQAAGLIRRNLRRPPDVAARFRGEVFILLLLNTYLAGDRCVDRNILESYNPTEVKSDHIQQNVTKRSGDSCQVPH